MSCCNRLRSVALLACFASAQSLFSLASSATHLTAMPEFLRPDPYGGIVPADRGVDGSIFADRETGQPLLVRTARGGWASLHLVVKIPEGGSYRLSVEAPPPIEVELFREWFHALERDGTYYPDALVPVSRRYESQIPDLENRVAGQKAQAFWLDVWVPSDAPPGTHMLRAILELGPDREILPIEVRVLAPLYPAEDVVTVDHNSYGSSWLARLFPGTEVPSAESFRLTHLFHRLFYEHRGTFHQLGYGHGGKVIREFAPEVAGRGRTRRIADWSLFDEHYAPLLDGSAFMGSRRGARPIPFVYLPINPEWPASFLGWGEKGYETEFVNVVAEMEQHFREKGWTETRFELFFNHKKRYKAFPWDGDEARFPEDDRYFVEYRRLLEKALPDSTPVKFLFRNDASWAMERQFETLAGVIDFWVCGKSIFSWYRDAPRKLKKRGDLVWLYGSAPDVSRPSATITENPLRIWIYGADGWVHWQTVDSGRDPWFHFSGGATALAYSGAPFGLREPLSSIRLKIQRNCLQDLALLDQLKAVRPLEQLKSDVAYRFNASRIDDWWSPRPPIADTPPYEWTNVSVDEATESLLNEPVADSWARVRNYLLELLTEAK